MGGWGYRSTSKRRSVKSNLSPVRRQTELGRGGRMGCIEAQDRGHWHFFVSTHIEEFEQHSGGEPQRASSPYLMLLFGSLSRVLQKQRVTSPSEKCKIPPDLSTATRHTGCYICLIYILTPKENHSSSVKTASYSWYGWWIFNWPNGFCTWWVLAGSGVNLYSVQGPEP